jgi:tetratricopeptide (TPR) repeat protein
MSKLLALLLLVATAVVPVSAQTRKPPSEATLAVQLDPRQIAVACALVVAGFGATPTDPSAASLRDEVRAGLAGVDPDLRARLAAFYAAHRRKDDKGVPVDEAADALRYRALAMLMNPPPSFSVALSAGRIPADLRELVGFASLAGELYRTNELKALLPKLNAAYGQSIALVGDQIAPTVTDIVAYLRTRPADRVDVPALRDPEGKLLRPAMTRIRRLVIYVDPLVGGQIVAVRGDLYDAETDVAQQVPGDRFAIFAGPLLAADEAALRVGVFRFVVAPIVEKNRFEVDEARDKIDILLERSPDAKKIYEKARLTLVTDSLVSALNARFLVHQGQISENGAVALVGDAYDRGELLAPHFYDRLKRFDEVGLDIAVFFPEFTRSLDPNAEKRRGEEIAAARAALDREPKRAPGVANAAAAEILTADRLITEKRFGEARPILERLLQANGENARALFGLAQVVENSPDEIERDPKSDDDARIDAQSERLETAVNLYRKAALNASTRELWLASWSHVYAGRILDFLALRDEAVAEYQAAVKVGDVPQGAFKQAQAGLAAGDRPDTP